MKISRILNLPLLVLVFVLLVAITQAGADNSRGGTRVFNFLKIEVAARPTAMGGAFTGVANDEAALYYNPSGVAELEGKHFILGYHNSIFDMQSGFLGYVHPLGEGKRFLAYVNYLNYGDFIRTDSAGVERGTFSGSDMLFGVGYAAAVNKNLKLGGAAKFIYERVDEYSATGFAVDLGGIWTFNNRRTSFGLMIQNLGAQLGGFTNSAEKDPLPLRFKGGVSTRPKGLPLMLAADVVLPTDNDIYFSIGGEYLNLKPLFLRLGWTSYGDNYKTDSNKDNLAGFSGGFGIEYKRMQISYTISPQAELGTSHRITLTGGFE